MTETTRNREEMPADDDGVKSVFERKGLTYSNTFDSGFRRNLIRLIEWMTGKYKIVRMLRQFEREWPANGKTLWRAALDVMGIKLETPQAQLDLIPKTGPVVLVANHPHGMVDGMVMADLIEAQRKDYKLLTRSVLTAIHEDAGLCMISVPFPHQPDAQEKMIEMRRETMAHLKRGGLVALFPSGVVASSETMFGPAVEKEWNVFTAKLIRMSGAKVVPCFFPGSNSRWYQVANRLSATLRQGLLLHEVVHSCNRPQKPVVGAPISAERMKMLDSDPRGFMTWLREHTLELGRN